MRPLQFWRYSPFSFAFKTAKISLWTMDYSPWGSKIESAHKVEVDVKYMETNFGGQGLFSFGNFFPFFVCLTEFGGHGPSDFGDFAPF